MKKNILIIEDEMRIRFLLRDYLISENFTVIEAADGDEGLLAFEKNKVDLILLDIMMPKVDGITVLETIRKTSDVPVILLTAKSQEEDKLFGYEVGADDYITKPFGIMELVARVKARLRGAVHEDIEYRLGCLYVCPARHTVQVGGEAVCLTLKEYELLTCLLENKDKVLSRDMLLNTVWGYSFDGESRTVDVHIRTLRQKLGAAGELIETVRGVGYKISEV